MVAEQAHVHERRSACSDSATIAGARSCAVVRRSWCVRARRARRWRRCVELRGRFPGAAAAARRRAARSAARSARRIALDGDRCSRARARSRGRAPRRACARDATIGSTTPSLGVLVVQAVLLDQRLAVEAERLGVGAQEALHERGARQQAPLFVLERAQVLGPDLRRGLDLGRRRCARACAPRAALRRSRASRRRR